MRDRHFRVAVIGAGPAGSTVTNALLLAGVDDVALIDRERFPRDKTCGDAITGASAWVMHQIGLENRLRLHPRITLFEMHAPSGISAAVEAGAMQSELPETYVIPRTIFDSYIAKAAFKRGAANHSGWTLDKAVFEPPRWRLELASTGNLQRQERRGITADFLIGADGAASRVRRSLGLALNSPRHTMIAARAYVSSASAIGARMRVDLLEKLIWPGLQWMYATDTNSANIGIGTEIGVYQAQPKQFRDLIFDYQRHLGDSFAVDVESIKTAPLPHAGYLPPVAFPDRNAALVGDAASMINPASGEGISYGMAAGLLLGEILADALNTGTRLSSAAARYQEAFDRRIKPQLRNGLLLRLALQRRPLMERILRAYRKSPEAFHEALNFWWGSSERPTSIGRTAWLLLRALAM